MQQPSVVAPDVFDFYCLISNRKYRDGEGARLPAVELKSSKAALFSRISGRSHTAHAVWPLADNRREVSRAAPTRIADDRPASLP